MENMRKNEIVEKLTPIVCEAFGVNSIKLNDEMSAQTVDQWTSLSFMMLLTKIEENFGFKFKMMEMLNLKTMGNIISAIERHTV